MKKEKERKEKQLQFGLKNTPKNIYFKYKDQYELWLAGLETKKFIKDSLTWFTIILSSSFLFTEMYMIETTTEIPSEIPVLNYFLTPSKRLVSNEYIYLFPFLTLLILIISISLSNSYYHKERELSKTVLIVMLLVNLSICLIFLNLFYLF
ncbi:MAG: hypothetical protein UR61_C0007G0004 [candidate division WS6 bacterium GW2011_GWE1_34_7]|uniref:Uncharacterized protein n=1 Tax=candidate division WS6 bacterium GW2011_GWE1_34_7 TaxID=1619093 RepID=A0A0G0B9B5_9BACT|nr:MAG: hypothetical protein UR61_C0007G0004 [candidate division WS6 bacterium GW2011_GWE1_34_7]